MANIEALNELIRVVRSTPESDFDMERWNCGSVGCALGRAAMDDYFKDRGLSNGGDRIGRFGYQPIFDMRTKGTFSVRAGVCAGAAFFQIGSAEAEQLFVPDNYQKSGWTRSRQSVDRETVIARIQQTIDHHTLQRDSHVRAYRSVEMVHAIMKQAMVEVAETVN